MNGFGKSMLGVVPLLITAAPAWAVDTTQTYSSGILVGVFVAFCALIIVFQLMPTIMLLIGFLKGIFKSSDKQARRQRSRA